MTAAQYAALLGLWIAGIISPGPDVLVILRNTFLTTRGKAMLTAAGVMVGNLMWITLSLTGVTLVLGLEVELARRTEDPEHAQRVHRLVAAVAVLALGWSGRAAVAVGGGGVDNGQNPVRYANRRLGVRR
mgnify:CR=1 FL=1